MRKFRVLSLCKISLKVSLLRLLLGSLLFAVGCDTWLFLLLAISPQTSQWSVNSCAIDQSVTPFLGWRRVCLLQKSQQSVFSRLVSIVIITSWFAIALDEIRTRRILREKADCKQSRWEVPLHAQSFDFDHKLWLNKLMWSFYASASSKR